MKHVNLLSKRRPALAQFEPVLQVIGIISSILSLPQVLFGSVAGYTSAMSELNRVFNIPLPDKGD